MTSMRQARYVLISLWVASAFVVAQGPAGNDANNAAGRAVYATQACWQCHRQQKDGAFPRLVGTRRAGPVLDQTRVLRSREWRKALLFAPRTVASEATMPAYRSLFTDHPLAKDVAAFVAQYDTADESAHQDGIVTRAEYERQGAADWVVQRTRLDTTKDGVVSGADGAPTESAALRAMLEYLDRVARKPRLRVKPPAMPNENPVAMIARGQTLYTMHCAGCHGARGDGNGPAAMFFPRHPPRNFLRGLFKFRSTGAGEPPTDQDLFRTIRVGAGGSMPAWPQLTTPEIWDLVAFVKSHHPAYLPDELIVTGPDTSLRFVQGTEAEPVEVDDAAGATLKGGRLVKRAGAWWWRGKRIEKTVTRDGYTFTLGRPVYDWMAELGPTALRLPKRPPLPSDPEAKRLGKLVYDELRCASCHGDAGQGDGPSAATTRDSLGRVILPADYTTGVWKGGDQLEDIVRTLMTGISGTPMPSYEASLKQTASVAPELAPWVLARYIQSQSEK